MEFNPNRHGHATAGRGYPSSYASNPYGTPYMSPQLSQQSTTVVADPQSMMMPYGGGDDGGGYNNNNSNAMYQSYYPQPSQPQQHPVSPYTVNYSAHDPTAAYVDHALQHQTPTIDNNHNYDPWVLPAANSSDLTESTPLPTSAATAATTVEPGSFYPVAAPLTPPPIMGSSVSALAYDTEYQALHVASHCQNMSSGSSSSSSSHHHHAMLRNNNNPSLSAASMLLTHSTKDGMLYSSCAGHPQANSSTLQKIYQLLYQGYYSPSHSSSSTTSNIRIPPHAYRPPYGRTTTTVPSPTAPTSDFSSYQQQQQQQHMGISHLLPVGGQKVASVSPAAVRIHNHGGLCLMEHTIEGMLCGTMARGHGSVPTHMLVGGLPILSNNNNNNDNHPPSTNDPNRHNSNNTNWTSGYQRQPPSQQQQQQQQQQNYHGHVHTLDVWQGLRIVASRTLYSSSSSSSNSTATTSSESLLAVTSMATTLNGSSILAGCTDGFVRMLDGRSLREVAKVKSHAAGVVQVATNDYGNHAGSGGGGGTLMATTGYATRGSGGGLGQYHAYPGTTVLIYDIRFLGRGGIPHPFSGMQGGPRFISFIPSQPTAAVVASASDDYQPSRLLIASGQAGGGIQIIQPFTDEAINQNNFFLPPLQHRGESITAMYFDSQDCTLALGTSAGSVLQYKMAKYSTSTKTRAPSSSSMEAAATSTTSSTIFVPGQGLMTTTTANQSMASDPIATEPAEEETKQPLEIPSYLPELPPLSLEASLLQYDETGGRIGTNDKIKSIFTSYIMCAEPKLSRLGIPKVDASSSMGHLANQRIVAPGRRQIASSLLQQAATSTKGDFLVTVPISQLKVDLLDNHSPPLEHGRQQHHHQYHSRQQQLQHGYNSQNNDPQKDPLPNPNKLLFTSKLNALCYEPSLNQRRKGTSRQSHYKERIQNRGSSSEDDSIHEDGIMPPRYRLTVRPSFKAAGTFNHSHYNDTGLWPGWDYPPTMPNAFAPSVLMLLYFIPEVRAAALKAQFNGRPNHSSSKIEKSVSPELGFLFHHIDSRSRYAMSYPLEGNNSPTKARIGAWFPSNFLTTLAVLPEAEALQILDGSPAAVETPRRPEAFFRFLLYQLDKELSVKKEDTKLMDSLSGIDFVSINEFITGTGPPTQSSTRALTVDLSYDRFLARREQPQQGPKVAITTRFGEVLRHALCRETRLRAWNTSSRSYETIVQRKIATTLPDILSLSCACAGRKEEDGLFVWRASEAGGCFLPDMVEVDLEEDGDVVVHELIEDEQGNQTWTAFHGETSIPSSVSSIVLNYRVSTKRKQRYRLDAVISFVRDDLGDNEPLTESSSEKSGHHILHMRVSKSYQTRSLNWQVREVERLTSSGNERNNHSGDDETTTYRSMVLTGDTNREVYEQRREHLQKRLVKVEESSNEWVLVNGFVVSNTIGEDARSFHVLFKEPCLVVYQAVESDSLSPSVKNRIVDDPVVRIPPEVFHTKSLSTGKPADHIKSLDDLPKAGDILALDAEFVSVQDEQTTLNESGQKFVLQETRHAVARISVVNCQTGRVLLDDHVLPREQIIDCLTRFSGIVAADLDPKSSPRHLISARSAYLKLRYLIEMGCIFVGHGLSQDFWQMNLVVPPDQIIDTVHIFHQDRMRYISLRFLTNYVLHRDMQQDTHDSIEDAKAAYDLYRKAAEWKREGKFDKFLHELYEYGQKSDWKLGVDDP